MTRKASQEGNRFFFPGGSFSSVISWFSLQLLLEVSSPFSTGFLSLFSKIKIPFFSQFGMGKTEESGMDAVHFRVIRRICVDRAAS